MNKAIRKYGETSRAIRKCLAVIEKQNKDIQVIETNLITKLSFGLEEMEKWIMDNDKPRRVKCYYPKTDPIEALNDFLKEEN